MTSREGKGVCSRDFRLSADGSNAGLSEYLYRLRYGIFRSRILAASPSSSQARQACIRPRRQWILCHTRYTHLPFSQTNTTPTVLWSSHIPRSPRAMPKHDHNTQLMDYTTRHLQLGQLEGRNGGVRARGDRRRHPRRAPPISADSRTGRRRVYQRQ